MSAVFDQLDVVSYEEVVRLPAFKRKTLVLIGNFSGCRVAGSVRSSRKDAKRERGSRPGLRVLTAVPSGFSLLSGAAAK